MAVAKNTPDGYRINTAFGHTDYPDVIFDISSSELMAIENYMDPII